MYTTIMSAHGTGVGIDFNFHGTIANTLDAHRLIQHYQEEKGPETADRIVNCKFIPLPLLPSSLQYFLE